MQGFFDWFGSERSVALEFVCSDMWKPYLNLITAKAGQATHILDRYHIMATINKAIDKVRAEAKWKFSSGIVEGFNNKAKLTMGKTYGFRMFKVIEIELYQAIGGLPESQSTHRII